MKPLVLSLLLSASASAVAATQAPMSLEELKGLDQSIFDDATHLINTPSEEMARYKALEQVAISIGAQHGFASEIEAQKALILEVQSDLDKAIDFRQIMFAASGTELELFLLPPVIREFDGMASVNDSNTILRITEKTYQIHKPERLVLSPPNWREYLIMDQAPRIKQPHPSMLPTTEQEQEVWEQGIQKGWEAGVQQGAREMESRILDLHTDYVGMLKYMRMVQEGKITEPVITKVAVPVAGDGQELRINDVTYRLTLDSRLESAVQYWTPMILDPRESLR